MEGISLTSQKTITIEKPKCYKTVVSNPAKKPVVAKPVVASVSLAKPVVAPEKSISKPVVAKPVVVAANLAKPVVAADCIAKPVLAKTSLAKPVVAKSSLANSVVSATNLEKKSALSKAVVAEAGLTKLLVAGTSVAGVKEQTGQTSKPCISPSVSKPAVSTATLSGNKPGTKVVTLSQKQDTSINSLRETSFTYSEDKIMLKASTNKEKSVTLDQKKNSFEMIKPIVKTVEIPKRVSVAGKIATHSPPQTAAKVVLNSAKPPVVVTTEQKSIEIEKSSVRTETPVAKVAKVVVKVEKPVVKVEKPLVIAEKPVAKADKPLVKAEKPVVRIEKPVVKAEKQVLVMENVAKPVVVMNNTEKTSKQPSLNIKLESKPKPEPKSGPSEEAAGPSQPASSSEGQAAVETNGVTVAGQARPGQQASLVTSPGFEPGLTQSLSTNSGLPVGKPAVESKAGLESLDGAVLPGLLQAEDQAGDPAGEMIYLLVEDGQDANLENQTLYIDPSQLAAAGGLMLAGGGLSGPGGGPILLQTSDAEGGPGLGQLLLQTSDAEG